MSNELRLQLEYGHHLAGRLFFVVAVGPTLAASHACYEIKTELHGFIAELRLSEGSPGGAPYTYRKVKQTGINILIVIMASGIARGRICTTTTDSRKVAAILQLIGCLGLLRTSLILDIHVMVN